MQRMHVQKDREQDADAVARYLGKLQFETCKSVHRKSMEESTRLREQGNAAYKRQDLNEAMRKYTRSIATAPCDGNTTGLALAFANRSAVNFSLLNVKECLSDIEQALKVNYPSRLRYKVIKRRAECYQALGDMEAARKNLEEAIACCLEEDKKRSMEQELAALKSPEQVFKPRLRVRPPPEKYLGDNPMIPGASACIEIKYNEKYGRHLVATQDIPLGAVLIKEEPFVSVLYTEKCDVYCFHCVRRCSAMIPCKSCTQVMYCSEACRDLSWTEYHDLECALRMKLSVVHSSVQSVTVLRLFIVALKKHGNLQQLCDYVMQLDSEVIEGIRGCDSEGRFDPTDLRAWYSLTQRKLPADDGNMHTKICAFLVNCIDENSQLFHGHNNEMKRFIGGLLLTFMRIYLNNAFGVQEWPNEDPYGIGSAIFSISSLINHRCIANAVQCQRGNTMVVYSVLPIDKGEEVLISYHGGNGDLAQIQAKMLHVEAVYGFKCGCRGCTNPLPVPRIGFLPLCPKCRTVVNIPLEQVVKCPHCNKSFNAGEITASGVLLINTIQEMREQPLNLVNIPKLIKTVTKLHRNFLLSNKLHFGVQNLLQKAITQLAFDQIQY